MKAVNGTTLPACASGRMRPPAGCPAFHAIPKAGCRVEATGHGIGDTGYGLGHTGRGIGQTGCRIGHTGCGIGHTGCGIGHTGWSIRAPIFSRKSPVFREKCLPARRADATPSGLSPSFTPVPRQARLRRANLGLNDGTPPAFVPPARRSSPALLPARLLLLQARLDAVLWGLAQTDGKQIGEPLLTMHFKF